MHMGMLCSTIMMYFFSPVFYRAFGNSVYFMVYIVQPVASSLSIILMQGYFYMYYTKIMSMQIYLNMICCINSGVLTFRQCIIYAMWVVGIFLAFHIYQFRAYCLENPPETSDSKDYMSLPGFLIFFVLSTIYSLINSFVHLQSEIAAFNNLNLGATTAVKIKDFVDRLLPKHVKDLVATDALVGDNASDVTLLFADIVGFTSYSSSICLFYSRQSPQRSGKNVEPIIY